MVVGDYSALELIAAADSTLLEVLRCRYCEQWFQHDLSLRHHLLTPEEARDTIEKIRGGL